VNVALLLVNATRADDGRRARLAGDVLPHSIARRQNGDEFGMPQLERASEVDDAGGGRRLGHPGHCDVRTGDLLKESPQLTPYRPVVGIDPKLSDAELVTLAVMQAPYWVSPPRPAGRAHVGLPPTRNGRVDLDRRAD